MSYNPQNPNGQAAMANSSPVVVASDQSAVPVSAASLPLPTGAATAALQTQPGVDIGDVTVNNGSGAGAVNIQDGGNSITVDGSVTAVQATGTNLHTVVDSGSITATQGTAANLKALVDINTGQTVAVTQGTGTNLHTVVDSGTITVGNASGASAVNIQDGGNSITVDYATTGSGTATGALRVELPTNGTGVIDKIVTSIVPGTAATNLGKAEDAGHTTGDTGVFVLGVRNDALSSFTSNDLDYSPIAVSSTGKVMTGMAPSAAMVRGTATTTGTGDTSLVAASGSASLKTYITSVQIANTGSSTSLITFKDGNAGTTLGYTIAPAGGGSNIIFEIPLVTSANTAFYFTAATGSTTIYGSAQGYLAP